MHILSLQLGKLLGCVIGLKISVTGITIIAIGTSLPDTFASRSAALQDIGADASIGNITGEPWFDPTQPYKSLFSFTGITLYSIFIS